MAGKTPVQRSFDGGREIASCHRYSGKLAEPPPVHLVRNDGVNAKKNELIRHGAVTLDRAIERRNRNLEREEIRRGIRCLDFGKIIHIVDRNEPDAIRGLRGIRRKIRGPIGEETKRDVVTGFLFTPRGSWGAVPSRLTCLLVYHQSDIEGSRRAPKGSVTMAPGSAWTLSTGTPIPLSSNSKICDARRNWPVADMLTLSPGVSGSPNRKKRTSIDHPLVVASCRARLIWSISTWEARVRFRAAQDC